MSSMSFLHGGMKFEQWGVSCRMKSDCIPISLNYLEFEQNELSGTEIQVMI